MDKKKKINQYNKEILRFITCGSVDDGKSTLLGRMLYEKEFIFHDQINEIKKATKKFSSSQNKIDYLF